jgi:hypothetical protein
MPFYKRLRRSLSTLKACASGEVVWEIGSAEGQSPFAGAPMADGGVCVSP